MLFAVAICMSQENIKLLSRDPPKAVHNPKAAASKSIPKWSYMKGTFTEWSWCYQG